ncbi:MAG: right-handed parallel beta-helix repeat-containing protein [Bacteroidota bacterium]
MKKILALLLIASFASCVKEDLAMQLRPGKGKGKGKPDIVVTGKYYPKTIEELNRLNLAPGDSVFLSGNYTGNIIFAKEDSGAWIGGAAIIKGTAGYGIHILAPVTIDGALDVSGYAIGVVIQASDVRLKGLVVHDNQGNGIQGWTGKWPAIDLKNVYVGYCKVYNNHGDFGTSTHSGSGIVLGSIDRAVIEYCEAFENGKNNRSTDGGPIGIWLADCTNSVIQYSKSHHNRAGSNKDGGGFDLDGGCSNSTIQYCESWENEGAGYGLYEWGSPNSYTGNTVRYNTSLNDGRANGYGAISFWAADGFRLSNTEVYGNTFTGNGVHVIGSNFFNVVVRDNVFVGAVKSEPGSITFLNNQYR